MTYYTGFEVMPSGAIHAVKAARSYVDAGIIPEPMTARAADLQSDIDAARASHGKSSESVKALQAMRHDQLRRALKGGAA